MKMTVCLRKKELLLLFTSVLILAISFSFHTTSSILEQLLHDGGQMRDRIIIAAGRDSNDDDDGDNDDKNQIIIDGDDDYDDFDVRLPSQKMLDELKLELNHTKSMIEPIQIAHRAVAGLGHRLKWTATTYHLVKAMNLTNGLFNSWGWECKGKNEDGSTMDIFHYLFGDDVLPVKLPSSPDDPIYSQTLIDTIKKIKESSANPTTLADVKEMRFINEGPAIYDIVNPFIYENYINHSIIEQKIESDFEMYTRLRTLYRHSNVAHGFTEQHQYDEHFVFGVHIRAGNGEKGHFENRQRVISDLDQWLTAFATMVVDFVSTDRYTEMANGKRPLLFVATDTPRSINFLTKAMEDAQTNKGSDISIPVIHFSQEYMEEGAGVSYAAKFETSDRCYQSWSDQFMDMTLLSASDVVIAGQYSAFTQAMPITIAIASPNPSKRKLFCEVGVNGDVMECVGNYTEWVDLHYAEKPSSIPLIGNTTSEKQAFVSRFVMPIFSHRPESMEGVKTLMEGLFK